MKIEEIGARTRSAPHIARAKSARAALFERIDRMHTILKLDGREALAENFRDVAQKELDGREREAEALFVEGRFELAEMNHVGTIRICEHFAAMLDDNFEAFVTIATTPQGGG